MQPMLIETIFKLMYLKTYVEKTIVKKSLKSPCLWTFVIFNFHL